MQPPARFISASRREIVIVSITHKARCPHERELFYSRSAGPKRFQKTADSRRASWNALRQCKRGGGGHASCRDRVGTSSMGGHSPRDRPWLVAMHVAGGCSEIHTGAALLARRTVEPGIP